VLVDMRAAQERSPYMGLDIFQGKVTDMKISTVIEPYRVKKQAIQSAAEAAEMVLRIDDMIASTRKEPDMEGMPPGMGGMGEMPPM
ncbi:MAG: TCP-1/cpn60 chaperonin family protein, partial [Methanothermobacter sp.]